MQGMTNSPVAKSFFRSIGLKPKELYDIRTAILFHDVGKMGVHKEILDKRGCLSEIEYEEVKHHSDIGSELASELGLSPVVVRAIKEHHERMDGSGYPDGIDDEKIGFYARIIMLLDVFDVMHRGRPYKSAMSKEEIVNEFRQNAGIKYDKDLAYQLVETIEKTIK